MSLHHTFFFSFYFTLPLITGKTHVSLGIIKTHVLVAFVSGVYLKNYIVTIDYKYI